MLTKHKNCSYRGFSRVLSSKKLFFSSFIVWFLSEVSSILQVVEVVGWIFGNIPSCTCITYFNIRVPRSRLIPITCIRLASLNYIVWIYTFRKRHNQTEYIPCTELKLFEIIALKQILYLKCNEVWWMRYFWI